MKVQNDKSLFLPVAVELETEDELRILAELLEHYDAEKIVSIINNDYDGDNFGRKNPLKDDDIHKVLGGLSWEFNKIYEREWIRRQDLPSAPSKDEKTGDGIMLCQKCEHSNPNDSSRKHKTSAPDCKLGLENWLLEALLTGWDDPSNCPKFKAKVRQGVKT